MKALCLLHYPHGTPQPGDFALRELPDPVPGTGEALVQVTHLSMDPLPRLRMQEHSPVGPAMRIGAPVEGRGVGRVLQSNDPGLAPGDMVVGELGWQSLSVVPTARLVRVEGGRPEDHLNALGATGLAAWFVVDRLAPRDGESLLVAPAAGAVGSLVCQMAQACAPGVKVSGTAVGTRQAAFLETLGVRPLRPEADWPGTVGIDLFVDGVGGALHERMFAHLNPRARVLLLGFVSAYGDDAPPQYGNAAAILMKRARVEGFLLSDHMDRAEEARTGIARWLADGTLRPAETVHRGLASAATAFAGLFADSPPGKQIVELEDAG
ncbi:NADP-dependent oxidoreductase [Erythrobacter sp. NFXS35]|uniref:NADP-dependent oxidoreductase n=1 Tax=Erythrobacter sp. NFXS35 TaxID=2818436 RepID=UPI0032DF793B